MSEEEKKAIEYIKSRLYCNEGCNYIDVAQEDLRIFINLVDRKEKDIEGWKKYCEEIEEEQTEMSNKNCELEFEVEKLQKENEELKEKYDKDTHTLQNQLDIANADRVEKDKIIDLMANFMNKRSWKEHQVKDDICFCCKIEYSSEECVKCIKQYFKKKVRNK